VVEARCRLPQIGVHHWTGSGTRVRDLGNVFASFHARALVRSHAIYGLAINKPAQVRKHSEVTAPTQLILLVTFLARKPVFAQHPCRGGIVYHDRGLEAIDG